MLELIGIIGGVLFLVGEIPYVRDIFRGKTKPQRVTWGIFFLLNAINLFNQAELGATSSLWLVGAWVAATLLVFCLSIKRGVGGFAKLDIFCLLGAAVGLVLWFTFNEPVISLLCNLAVSTIAYIPTIKKAYLSPSSETKISWLIGSIASLFAIASTGSLGPQILALPVYSFITSFSVYIVLVLRRGKL